MSLDRKLFACSARKPQRRLRHASLSLLRMLYSDFAFEANIAESDQANATGKGCRG